MPPTYDELMARIVALENREITVDDIPVTSLQRRLEQKWKPDASLLLQPYSITTDLLDTRMTSPAYRSVRGSVNVDGTIAAGTGFTVVRDQVGSYTVTFTTAFAAAPAVTVTLDSGTTWAIGNLLAALPDVSSFTYRALTYDATAAMDAAFCFIAATPS